MANAVTIDLTGLEKLKERLKAMPKEVAEGVDDVLSANAIAIATKAKELAPVDIGGLRSSIGQDISKPLEKHVTVNAGYAAWVEFGTGSYAADYVGSLPATWREFAMRFKGKTGGSFADLVNNLEKWVQRNVTATYSIKTQKRTKTTDEKTRTKQLAYIIAISILKKGIKPHRFLFPAYEQQRGQILDDIVTVLKSLS
jgi:HK97 gp10 family phage protein